MLLAILILIVLAWVLLGVGLYMGWKDEKGDLHLLIGLILAAPLALGILVASIFSKTK